MSHRQPFLNIRTEGALLPSDLLSRLMEGTNLPGLKPEDYHLGAGEKLNEAISRSWTRLLSLWLGFRKAKAALPASDLGTTLTRERWLLQLFQELGYGRLLGASPFEIDEKTYPISHVWQGQHYKVPIHLVSFRADLDKRSEQRIQGASKASPHGMVQEFLNRSEHVLWAFVSNGLKLLILRDNASLTRQAYVEFDLEGIFEGEAYADFRLLWMVCHQSRVEGTAKDRPETCWLEQWSKQAQTDGRRALDQLRVGVQKALENLGTGFIAHKANQSLRDRLQAGELQKQDFYRQLLRLVYRLIFLFVAEDRDLLHFPGASDDARSRYARFYSGQRLRRMAERTRGSRHADLWVGLRLVFAKLGNDYGCPELGLPALGGFLFGSEAMPDIESAELANEHLLLAIRNLALVKDRSGWRLVDYRNLGSEELGSVYESLLELNPTMELPAGIFTLGTVAGNQRKTSGSYYTPDSLVQCLLDSALDPVVEQAIKGKTATEAEKAILALKVCDPAVGSGHFLVGAAHRLAKHLANVRAQAQGESEPSPLYYQHALRDVIGHCLYGVDLNPMAAELCRVSLWLEAIEPGKPLSFLDHHIRVGNSLLGATPALLAKGIPDEAFTPIEGDDKEICSRFKKVNKTEKIGYRRLFAATTEPWERLGDLAASMVHLDNAPDDSIQAIRNKERMYEAMVRSGNYLDGQFWADTWCAAFVWKKTREFNHPIAEEDFRRIEHNPHACDSWMRDEIIRLSQQYQFFHWHLAFPDVFHVPAPDKEAENEEAGWNGGFDVVLGNPPWEKINLKDEEFFAQSHPEIANALNKADRKHLIARLRIDEPSAFASYEIEKASHDRTSAFFRLSGRFPLTGISRINLYSVFSETAISVLSCHGRIGMVLASGIVTDDNNKNLFALLVKQRQLISALDFENSKALFPEVHRSFRFVLLCAGGKDVRQQLGDFAFNLTDVSDIQDAQRHFALSPEDFLLLNPITEMTPAFRSELEAELAKHIYRYAKPWSLHVSRTDWPGVPKTPFNMSNDSGLFVDRKKAAAESTDRYLPLYESKFIHQYNHRFGTFTADKTENVKELSLRQLQDPEQCVDSRYYLDAKILAERFPGRWFLVWRDITGAPNERTSIATVIPNYPCAHTLSLLESLNARSAILICSTVNSLPYDYCARQKVTGTHLNHGIWKQLPLVPLSMFLGHCSWSDQQLLCDWLLPRVLELIYTAWDLKYFAQDCGNSGPPFRWDDERRFLLRCELDAAFFHLYLPAEENGDWRPAENETAEDRARLMASFPTPRAAVAYIMDTFPIVKRKDEAKWNGDYRTKRVILEIYDAMAEAMRTGVSYQTRLSPPPADAAVAHPWPVEMPQQAPTPPNPLEELCAVANAAWETPSGVSPDNVALFTLIEVMRLIDGTIDSERVRVAANLVRSPATAAAFMDEAQAAEWVRVVGQDARPLPSNVIQISQFQQGTPDLPWADAVKQLKGSGAIVVDSNGKWSASSKLQLLPEQDWIRERAAVAVQLLSAIEPVVAERKVLAFIRSVEDGTARRAVS
jgi:hypothetical protein